MTPPRSVEAWADCGEHGGCDVFSPDCPYCRDNRRNFIDYAAERVAQVRVEEREALSKVIHDLMAACETLMDEVTHQKATKCGVVNDAMVAGAAAIRART